MQSSALDETAAHQLLALLAASGVDARIQEFHDSLGLMGWLIEGKKKRGPEPPLKIRSGLKHQNLWS
jgi:hypothetical protein